MEKTVEREELSVLLRDVGGGREAPGVRTEREGVLSSVRVSARVPSSQLGKSEEVSFFGRKQKEKVWFCGRFRGSVARRHSWSANEFIIPTKNQPRFRRSNPVDNDSEFAQTTFHSPFSTALGKRTEPLHSLPTTQIPSCIAPHQVDSLTKRGSPMRSPCREILRDGSYLCIRQVLGVCEG